MTISFEALGLDTRLIEGLKKCGINEPTEIQSLAIPPALQNRDIIGQSQTGSGKTLAYLLPIFQRINCDKREMQAIILAPTHELVMQIHSQVKLLSDNSGFPVTSAAVIGEVNIERQIDKLKEKPHIIIGSTGRILELIKRKKISAHTIKTIVVDEVDRLLDPNNLAGVKDVIKTTMRDRQLMAFSATIGEKTLNTARDLMKDAAVITVKEKMPVNRNITHIYFTAEQRDKIEVLRKLIAAIKPEKAIVFINKSEEIQVLASKLQYHHIKAYSIFGSASKEERKKALEGFRNGNFQLLIASDIAARGLDIKELTHIFNLDLPENPMEYLHRTGRTGRVGTPGTAISIATREEKSLIRSYERNLHIEIKEKIIFNGVISEPGIKSSSKIIPKREHN